MNNSPPLVSMYGRCGKPWVKRYNGARILTKAASFFIPEYEFLANRYAIILSAKDDVNEFTFQVEGEDNDKCTYRADDSIISGIVLGNNDFLLSAPYNRSEVNPMFSR